MDPVGSQAAKRGLIKHAFWAILPSPDKINKSTGLNEIAAPHDFDIVWKWITSSDFLNMSLYDNLKETVDAGQQLGQEQYRTLIRLALYDVFEPIRNTHDPEEHEMVLLYYTGRGNEGKKKTSPRIFSKAQLPQNIIDEYCKIEKEVLDLKPDRKIKKGELSLHDVGFCDLQTLLIPWIAAVKVESQNAPEATKRNKHLVVIADSSYSGMLVEDWMELAFQDRRPWNQNGCTVTVQSAASSQENTLDGYFTPCFVHFNRRANRSFANLLIKDWNAKSEMEKDAYDYEELPSPQLASTMLFSKNEAALELNIQDSKLHLFHDARFFKFCFLSFSGILENKGRALTTKEATMFLSQHNFKILDYKLQTMSSSNTPMASVLVDDAEDGDGVVCVHIHFSSLDTDIKKVSGVNFIHHERPRQDEYLGLLFLEDSSDTKRIFPPHASEIQAFIKQCRGYVEERNPKRWADVSQWNMKQSYHLQSRPRKSV